MNNAWTKWLCTWGLAIGAVAVGLSIWFGVPYVYTLFGFAVWAFVGHLITLDDVTPGSFGNPDASQSVWRGSLMDLGLKILILIVLGVAVVLFPVLRELGAK